MVKVLTPDLNITETGPCKLKLTVVICGNPILRTERKEKRPEVEP